MTLRKLLIIPIMLSIGIIIVFSREIAHSLDVLHVRVAFDMTFFSTLVVAALLQLMGHVIRAYKMTYLLGPVKVGTTRFQFRALSIGSLCNVLLPFRLGELVRAKIIGSGERISFGLAIALVMIERALDIFILVIAGVVLFMVGIVGMKAIVYILLMLTAALAAAIGLSLIGRENTYLLHFWYKLTSVFHKTIRDSLRFKAWSVIYGLQRIFSVKRAVKYIGLSLLSWAFYLASLLLLMHYLLPEASFWGKIIRSVAPYFGISAPAGPASLGAFSEITNSIALGVNLTDSQRIIADLLSWGVLVIPVSVIGVILLLWKTKEPVMRHLPAGRSKQSLSDKLSRVENISPEMGNFLDNYFSGNTLARIVHRLELGKEFRLLRYFKGGSDAITVLALQDGEEVVKKIIPIDISPRLKAQYDWLQRRKGKHDIVRALREDTALDYYAIDLEYDERNEMFFEYMHHSSREEAKRVMDMVWEELFKSLYSKLTPVVDYEAVQKYIDKHIFGCMEMASSVNQELMEAAKPRKIKINGKSYLNLEGVMKKITSNSKAMKDIASFSRSDEVHGDVAIDNILVSRDTHRPLIIDPAPDGNLIVGPVFDFGKNMQSLYCGYEFIVRSDDIIHLEKDGSIQYYDRLSVPYRELGSYIRDELSARYLTEAERKAMIFHAGALHIRRLKHQVYQAPGLTLAIYAAGIRALNDFIGQYDH